MTAAKIQKNSRVGSGRSTKTPLFSRRKKARIYVVDRETDEAIDFDRYELSPVGAYLYSQYLFCTGEKLNIEISIPGNDTPLSVEGRVIRTDTDSNCGMGIAFNSIRAKDKRVLKSYIASRFIKNI